MIPVALPHLCHTIATHLLGEQSDKTRIEVGQIHLHPHQITALLRIRAALAEFGGALLCDEVGLGKTYVALAAAQQFHRISVVAPAVLRSMWMDALHRSDIQAEFISFEQLSQLTTPISTQNDFVIVDEAHHARTPSTKRYAALAQLCANAQPLFLSATPIHNKRDDLDALLTLIVGDRATSLTPDELARLIIRRTKRSDGITIQSPVVHPPRWQRLPGDETILHDIQHLPPSVPTSDGESAHALLVHSLVHQWASSEGALRAALQRRITHATAILSALDAGRHPSAHDLRLWTHGDDVTQLAFPELVSTITADAPALATRVRAHVEALHQLRQRLIPRSLNDDQRATTLREIRLRHPHQRIVAFSQYAATIHALFRALRNDGHVAALTATGGVVANGTISREEVLTRFTGVSAVTMTHAHAITLLITTDLLSEGVNLQEASVVVHLDLPWTHARLQQRVGRVARIGSKHRSVFVYGFLPSEDAEHVLRSAKIIRAKAVTTAKSIGRASIPEDVEIIRATLSRWRLDTPSPRYHDTPLERHPLVSVTPSPYLGALAALAIDGNPIIVHIDPTGTVSTAPHHLRSIIHTIDPSVDWSRTKISRAVVHERCRDIERWFAGRQAAYDAGVSHSVATTRLATRRRTLLRSIATLGTRSSITRRTRLAPKAAAAHRSLSNPSALITERSFNSRNPLLESTSEQLFEPYLPTEAGKAFPEMGPGTTLEVIALLLLAPCG